jgi:hypothetical protein
MTRRAPDIRFVNVHENLYKARSAEWILDLNPRSDEARTGETVSPTATLTGPLLYRYSVVILCTMLVA